MRGVAFTDHCDIASGRDVCASVKDSLASEAERARETYKGRLEISIGIELGEPHHNLSLARELVSDDRLDFVIGSLHCARGQQDYYYIDYGKTDLDAMMLGYYRELLELAESGFYSVIGHINYQIRYMPESVRKSIDLTRYYDLLREILKVVASSGKGIEINTSGIWRGIGFTLPSSEVVSMFRECGGEIVTTGSDAHSADHVGDALDAALKCLGDAGFDKFAFFRNGAPEFHAI